MRYLPVFVTIIMVTYGQLIIKYEVNKLTSYTLNNLNEALTFFVKLITNIGIISGLMAAVVAAFSWMVAIRKFDISSVYPLLSLNFVIVPLLSVYIFEESMNIFKIIGILLICVGIYVFSKGI